MSRASVEQLIDHWINDPSFRAALRADPEGTVRRSGLALTAEEWAAMRNMDWSLTDQELKLRVSKGA